MVKNTSEYMKDHITRTAVKAMKVGLIIAVMHTT